MSIERTNLQTRMRKTDEEHIDYLRNHSNYSGVVFLDNRESIRAIKGSLSGWFIPYITIADNRVYNQAVFIEDNTVFDWVVRTRQL